MWKKTILVSLWTITIGITSILTIVNYKPYFVMGGSTSVSPLMTTLMEKYPENHQDADFTYNSLGSAAAVVQVINNIFSIGWLSKSYVKPNNSNLISFVLSHDGMILVYNLPPTAFGSDKPLNFTKTKIKTMYSKKSVQWKELFPKNQAEENFGWIKPTYNKNVLPYSRENGSGTRDVFNENVLDNKDINYPHAITVNSSSQMFGMSEGGVGYGSFSDKKLLGKSNSNFKDVRIAAWEKEIPDLKTIKSKNYKLFRPFTGLINKNCKQKNTLVRFLNFLFQVDNQIMKDAFLETNFAQAPILLNDEPNYELRKWLT